MFEIVNSANPVSSDAERFIGILNSLECGRVPEARSLFDRGREITVARAPGRLDVMGGIGDYSGSLVLQWPIREATFVALQRNTSRRLRVVSLSEESMREAAFEMPLSEFESGGGFLDSAGGLLDYDSTRALLERDAARKWAAYVAGVFFVLMRERDVRFSDGAGILVSSEVPEGKGLSSSAALEVAVMQAVTAAFEISLNSRELALLCQTVENRVVGAPCGIMDQITAACGEADKLLALVCQPAELKDPIDIPEEMAFWGVDSGVRHVVAGEDYGSVRVGTFIGYRIIAELAGLKVSGPASCGRVEVDDPKWEGYLANLSPSEFERQYRRHIPDRIEGKEFLALYGGTTDRVTRVAEGCSYPVRAPTVHAVYENHRVRLFAELISEVSDEGRLELLGELMYQSHGGYSACGLGSARTDLLVDLVREAGPRSGLLGAKITGGGSGGTVAVLGRRGADSAVASLADAYLAQTGYRPRIFSGSSPGSSAFGHMRLRWVQ